VCAAVTGRRLRWPAGNSTEAQGYSPEVRGFYPLGPRAALQHTIISASALGSLYIYRWPAFACIHPSAERDGGIAPPNALGSPYSRRDRSPCAMKHQNDDRRHRAPRNASGHLMQSEQREESLYRAADTDHGCRETRSREWVVDG
jgi:hypothetical protein